jgi:epsilon-lactone hydrolase
MSLALGVLNLWLRFSEKRFMTRVRDVADARRRIEQQAARFGSPPGTRFRDAPLGPVPATWVEAPAAAPLLLWFHGGAYCLGSPRSHRRMVAALAARAGMRAVLPGYRLAPEHPFPAAPDDALAAWRALLDAGEDPAQVAIGGDSAGGGLAMALMHQIGATGLPWPACAVTFSPWVDLTLSGGTLRTLARREAMLPTERLPEIRDSYLAGADPADPRASPHLGRFTSAPPVMILASRREVLLDDARMMARRLEADGVAVTLELWDRVPHAWPLFQGRVPEADRALERAAGFIAARIS